MLPCRAQRLIWLVISTTSVRKATGGVARYQVADEKPANNGLCVTKKQAHRSRAYRSASHVNRTTTIPFTTKILSFPTRTEIPVAIQW